MTIVSANDPTDTFGAIVFVRARTGSREFAASAAIDALGQPPVSSPRPARPA